MRPDHDRDALELTRLYGVRRELEKEIARQTRAQTLTGQHVDAAITAGDELDRACAEFCRRHYPRHGRAFVAGWDAPIVYVVSAAGRKVRSVYPHPVTS